MTEQNRDATEFEEAAAREATSFEELAGLRMDRLEAVIGRWMSDRRAALAVAEDCDGNEAGDCRCLYCDSQRALIGK